jgi:arginase
VKIALIYATWPEPGRAWQTMAASFQAAKLGKRLAAVGHEVDERTLSSEPTLKGAFQLAGEVGKAVRAAADANALAVIVGGSCTVAAVGAVAGLGNETGILWMDAHPDANTPETTGSGMLDGMALAVATGLCWRDMAATHAGLAPASLDAAALYGARDIDPPEAQLIRDRGIPLVKSPEEAEKRLRDRPKVYIHLDMDVHDGVRFRANSFAVAGGPWPEEVGEFLAGIGGRLPVGAIAFTGVEPAASGATHGAKVAFAHIRALVGGMD